MGSREERRNSENEYFDCARQSKYVTQSNVNERCVTQNYAHCLSNWFLIEKDLARPRTLWKTPSLVPP